VGAIRLSGVTKTYRVGVGRARVREMLPHPLDTGIKRLFPRWWARNTFNALDQISLEIGPGSSVGLVGHNGAGKTTMLRVLAGVTAPTTGAVSVEGRTGALIDVVVGFHPDLTGRENVLLVGAIYGLGRRAMQARADNVFEFAETHEMADTPVKRYSSGMMSRLGFAILTALDPEILLVDEVLAVGDAAFQRKCVGWLEEYRQGGGTLLFVSHNLALVRSMTDRAIWLDHGRVRSDGRTGDVLARYAEAMERRDGEAIGGLGRFRRTAKRALTSRGMHRWGAGGVRIEKVHFEGPSGIRHALQAHIEFTAEESLTATIQLGFFDESDQELAGSSSGEVILPEGSGSVTCELASLPFRPGVYFPVVSIEDSEGRVRDRWRLDRAVVIEESGADGGFGRIELKGAWAPKDKALFPEERAT
jgi:ABC-type polysaccharide/polyol phosphate transport system ATPase subunit